jgi:hypothetical protein
MKQTRSTPASASEGGHVDEPCATCGRRTRHGVLKAVEYSHEFRDQGESYYAWNKYQVIECQGCQAVSFRHQHEDSEELEYDGDADGYVPSTTIKVYPSRVAGRRPLENTHLLPWPIRRIYDETREALGSGLHVLAGVGLRALIEAVCNERAAPGGNLEKRIDALVPQGFLTPSGAEILHSLRLIGNSSAHEVKPHSEDDLTVGLDVVEYVLNGVYLLPKLAASLPKRGAT